MQDLNMKLPTLKEIEVTFFRKLQEQFMDVMVSYLEKLDEWIMASRDTRRFRMHERREISLSTVFGEITFTRRMYLDRQTDQYVYLLDQLLLFEGHEGVSPHLAELAIELASRGPSYREASEQIEAFLGYPALSHETIRKKVLAWSEREQPEPRVKRKPKVLFVEVDGLFTHLQREKRRSKENKIAVVHEGWERSGERVSLKHKQYYLHTSQAPFWEGFGDFLTKRYDIDEETWFVVNGDGAGWIGECTSYFHQCLYTLDRFHVYRDLRTFLQDHPSIWRKARESLDQYDPDQLFEVLGALPDEAMREEWQEDWRAYKAFLFQHHEHLKDYRKALHQRGIDTTGMRPMGSAESQMNVIAKRTKGGYSWRVPGVEAMIQTIMARKEGRLHERHSQRNKKEKEVSSFRIGQLFKKAKEDNERYLDATIQYLKTSYQSSPLGMALKGLRG